MREIVLIFPHQLFKQHPGFSYTKEAVLVEEFLFFKQYRFHKQKLVLHRASMKAYADYLKISKIKLKYVEASDKHADTEKLIPLLQKERIKSIHIAEPADDWLISRLEKACQQSNINLVIHPSPGFLPMVSLMKSLS